MLTVIAYISLETFTTEYSGWFFVLPVLLDLVLISKLDK